MTNRETIENEIDGLLNSPFNRNDVLKFAEQMATLARADALEEAAKIADGYIGCDAISDKIRAMKYKESK